MKGFVFLAVAMLAAQQGAEVRLYRMVQAGIEVGRETYRADLPLIERSAVIPVLNTRLDSKAWYDSGGRFRRFEARVMNSAGDSLRGTYAIEALDDSLVATTVFGEQTTRKTLKVRRADGVVPAQSVSVIAEALQRAAGRDTVFQFVPMGGDTTVPVTVRFTRDTVYVTTASVPAYLLRAGGPRATIEVPAQRL